MTFGDLRSAVMSCRQDPQRICDVVWCVLKSDMREEALRYAVDNLSTLTVKETVNLGDLLRWVVEGDEHLAARIAANHDVPDDVRYEYLSTWAYFVVFDPKKSPPVGIHFTARFNCKDVVNSWPVALCANEGRACGRFSRFMNDWITEHADDASRNQSYYEATIKYGDSQLSARLRAYK